MTEGPPYVLIIDDETDLLESLQKALHRKGFQVMTAASGAEGLALASRQMPQVIVVDLRMPEMDGLEVLAAFRQRDPDLPVVLITAFAAIHTAVAAVQQGAFDYIAKPFSNDQLEVVIRRALSHRALVEENRRLHQQVREQEAFSGIVGSSVAMRRVLALVEKVAASDANVFITGESGTGKELVAKAIHQASARNRRTFVPIDCAALPETLLESELFGYEKGAFTGAVQSKVGLMEHASGGTLFLDEVTELARSLQAKLLRALQERTIRRVGGTELRAVDVRILSASNRDLDTVVREGLFREDLLYRLQVVTIELPPLRDRTEDIPLLARYFFTQLSVQASKRLEGISSAAMMVLEAYQWPGNVRELRNVVERAITLTESTHITPLDLPPALLAAAEEAPGAESGVGEFQREKQGLIAQFEREYTQRLLEDVGGNVAEAARRAGMERPAFHRLMRKYAIEAAPYRRT